MLTHDELEREAGAIGFPSETLEKVILLLNLLEGLRSHPFIGSRFALKGGTALNLFTFDVPRLSVDVDLNYIGGAGRETMIVDRPKVERAVVAVCGRTGLSVRRIPSDHAGGKWRLGYTTALGQGGSLEIDINFLLRVPLWPPVMANSKAVGSSRATRIPVLETHELAAGKIAACFARNTSRDVFDTRELMRCDDLNLERLRFAFVVYGGMNRKDWRYVSLDDIAVDLRDVQRTLLPMMRVGTTPDRQQVAEWTNELLLECRDRLSVLFPLKSNEMEFLEKLNERGEIIPELLTGDTDLIERLHEHPALRWKAINVRKHKGLPPLDEAGLDDAGNIE